MSPYFLRFKPRIDAAVTEYLRTKRDTASYSNTWGNSAYDMLSDFCVRGKTVRGCLLVLSYEIFCQHTHTQALQAAAALEILHSSILIHDDILDRDRIRRGHPSIHIRYERLARNGNKRDVEHFGRSMAACVGDLGFFTSFACLAEIPATHIQRDRLLSLFFQELQSVIVAQMQDVAWGLSSDNPTVEKIELLNRYKTARYTFSLPLIAGAMLAGRKEGIVTILEKFGEACGLAYQLWDDYLGFFGREKAFGKPRGSDADEGKRNLLYVYLKKSVRNSDGTLLRTLWGNTKRSRANIERLISLAHSYGLKEQIQHTMKHYQQEAYRLVDTLPCNGDDKNKLSDVIRFLSTRSA